MPEQSPPNAFEEASSLFWSRDGLRDAYDVLILRSGLPVTGPRLPGEPDEDPIRALHWIHRAPRALGLDVVEERPSLDGLLRRFTEIRGPVFIALLVQGQLAFLAAFVEAGGRTRVFKPDGSEARLRVSALHAALVRVLSVGSESLEEIFSEIGGGPAAFDALLREELIGGELPWVFTFTLDAAHTIPKQLAAAGAWRALGVHVAISTMQALIAFGAMWTLGSAAIDGRVDLGRVLAWTMLALSDAPLQYLANYALLDFSIPLAASIKKRVLEGSFFVAEKSVRARGFGELLARANEANIVEQLSLNEISGIVLAIFETMAAVYLWLRGASPIVFIALCAVTLALSAVLVRRIVVGSRNLFGKRVSLTDDLVDKIIGHRTRAIQQSPSQRHPNEDLRLSEYAREALAYDATRTVFSLAPRLWLLVSGVALLVCFVLRAPIDALLYSGLGILLVYRGLESFFPGLERLVEWRNAWNAVEDLVDAGRRRERNSREAEIDEGELPVTLSLSAVSFSYRQGGRPVLADVDLSVRAGEKVLIEGPSGSGKTTLLKLIAGEQQPSGGVILVGGSDAFSVSDQEWRRRVASAPQFHENYVFANTFAFNLDAWGQSEFATEEAAEICRELGLGHLVDRMPQGYAQILGETGWQLSHGERSRLYIARALLQHSDLFLFDENFGSLDPETLIQALECVRRRARTLIVIAHT